MTTRPYELLARFNADGTAVSGVSIRTITTIDGKDYESEPRPLSGVTDPAFVSFADQFSASVLAEKEALAAAHKTAIDAKQAELDTANVTIAALETRVASLLAELPFNPRIIDASAFYERITKDEFAALSVSDDETLRTIAKTILAYKTNDWPVIFESPEFQGLVGYLIITQFSTEARIAELTRDATRDEAYDAS
jgi:hypothetical protein